MTRPCLPTLALLAAVAAPALAQDADRVARGEYLVTTSACHDCHTPFVMGPAGPEPDMTQALSGHPQDVAIGAPAILPAPWVFAGNDTNTAWSGPWGVSFTANLTPDPETGILGEMNEEQFVQALRTGRHLGHGRPILPPMPWPVYAQMTDEDLAAIYAYLRQIPPVRNRVPDPIPPAE
jgi:mono/diheme cytochrome c family protein